MAKPFAAGGAFALTLMALTGCQGPTGADADRRALPAGCGLLDQQTLTGLLGPHVTASLDGNGRRLREHKEPLVCTTTATDGSGHVRVAAHHHPEPMDLPFHDCDAGRVYAGTPSRYAPACQQTEGTGGRTTLLARWGEYVVRVTIRRSDQNWGGDAEAALELSRQLATRLRLSP
jgi:hypothetical protein